jgi:hypothetical protein
MQRRNTRRGRGENPPEEVEKNLAEEKDKKPAEEQDRKARPAAPT